MPRFSTVVVTPLALAASLAIASPIAVAPRDSTIHSVSVPADTRDTLNVDLTERGTLIVPEEYYPDPAYPEKIQEYINSLPDEILVKIGLHLADDKKLAARDIPKDVLPLPVDFEPKEHLDHGLDLPGDDIKPFDSGLFPFKKKEHEEIFKQLMEKIMKDRYDKKDHGHEKEEKKREESDAVKGELTYDQAQRVIRLLYPTQLEILAYLSPEETVKLASAYLVMKDPSPSSPKQEDKRDVPVIVKEQPADDDKEKGEPVGYAEAVVEGKPDWLKYLSLERLQEMAREKLGLETKPDTVKAAPEKRDICWWTHCDRHGGES